MHETSHAPDVKREKPFYMFISRFRGSVQLAISVGDKETDRGVYVRSPTDNPDLQLWQKAQSDIHTDCFALVSKTHPDLCIARDGNKNGSRLFLGNVLDINKDDKWHLYLWKDASKKEDYHQVLSAGDPEQRICIAGPDRTWQDGSLLVTWESTADAPSEFWSQSGPFF
jgi:hypothetical protein